MVLYEPRTTVPCVVYTVDYSTVLHVLCAEWTKQRKCEEKIKRFTQRKLQKLFDCFILCKRWKRIKCYTQCLKLCDSQHSIVRFKVYKMGTSYAEEKFKLMCYVCVSARKEWSFSCRRVRCVWMRMLHTEKVFKLCTKWINERQIQTPRRHACTQLPTTL